MQKDRSRGHRKTNEENVSRWRPEFFGPVFQNATQSLPEVMEIHSQNRKTRILATMVPDELIYAINTTKKSVKSFIGIVFLADVSGMTTLHENYKYAGHGGSIGLNTILDAYFGYMVQAVYSYGGDVFKITGNGLLAIWNVRNNELIFNTLHEVITCGLRIQESIGRFVTSVNATLKLKVAISAGNLTFIVIGEKTNFCKYLMAGLPMEEAELAKNACLPGDLILAASAWGHCNPSCYEYVIQDTRNVKIQRIVTTARKSTRGKIILEEKARKKMFSVEERIAVYWERIDRHDDLIVASRPAINEAVLRRIGKFLKTFIVPSAVRLIESEKPLEYLTEALSGTAMFLNVVPAKSSIYNFVKLVDDIFILLSSTVGECGGHVIRVSLLQKDLTFLTIFGLKDDHIESHSKNALVIGMKLRNSLKNFYGVEKVSIGISTGMVHCGVVGHSLRREYIVVGSPLLKAMELAATCIEKVTCDLNTLLRSDLPRKKFVLQDPKVHKSVGLSSVYEYADDEVNGTIKNPELSLGYPILDRNRELNILDLVLDDIGLDEREHAGILVKGETGTGKSRLLDGFVTLIKSRDISVVTLAVTPDYAVAPHSVIYEILAETLDIDAFCSIEVREQKMAKLLGDVVSPQDFCYLNEIMKVRFPISKKCSSENEEERKQLAEKIIKEIFLMSKTRRCIIIDDIQNIDEISWQLLTLLLEVKYVMIISSIEIPLENPISESVSNIYFDKRIIHLKISQIDSQCITALASQILNVQAIPDILERELNLRTKNNPNYCQALVTAALCYGGLHRVEMTPKKAKEYGLIFPPVQMLSKIPFDVLPEDVAPPLPWERRLKIYACLISNQKKLFDSWQSVQINEMMLNTFNKLSNYEQELLKCAAVLGTVFTRHMLQNVMINYSNFHTTKAITNLYNLRILSCAALTIHGVLHKETLNICVKRKRNTFSDFQHLLYCNCSDPQVGDTYSRGSSTANLAEELPWYSRCKFLTFIMPRFRQVVYDNIENEERIRLHLKAIDLYKIEAHRCKACGGGNFLDIPIRNKINKRSLVAKTLNPKTTLVHKNIEETVKRESGDKISRKILRQDGIDSSLARRHTIPGAVVSHHPKHSEHNESRTDSTGSDGRRRVSILPFYTETMNDQTIASSESSIEAQSCEFKEIQPVDRRGNCFNWMKNRFYNKTAIEPEPEPNSKSLRVPRMNQFRGVDFRDCQCGFILNNIYKRLLYHSHTGNHIRYLIDYSAGLIRVADHLHAIKTLNRADELNKNYESAKDDLKKSMINRMLTKGTILSLLGKIYFQLGYYETARHLTIDEMAIYGYMIPTIKLVVCHQMFATDRHQLVQQWFPGLSMIKLSGKEVFEKSRISACISRLSSIFMTNDQPRLAKLTVLVSLDLASKCKDQGIVELSSYRLAMFYYRQIGEMRFCQRLEKSALKIIADQFNWNDLNGVLVVADVHESIFYSKLISGELQKAIEHGFKALQIAGKIQTIDFRLRILPILIQAVIQAKRISEAVDLLRELAYYAQETVDVSPTIWYYALCLDLILDAGVSLESGEKCQEFAKKLLDSNGKNSQAFVRDPDCSERLVTNMWLLLTRMGKDSAKYEIPRDTNLTVMRHNNYSNLSTTLKAVECEMLRITYFLNYKKGNALPDIREDIKEHLTRLRKASKTFCFLKPRLYLLEAYMNVIRGRMTAAKKTIDLAQKNARRQGSFLMQATIELHKRTWLDSSNNNSMRNSHWAEVADEEKDVKWHDVHNSSIDDDIEILYCLPKPENYL